MKDIHAVHQVSEVDGAPASVGPEISAVGKSALYGVIMKPLIYSSR